MSKPKLLSQAEPWDLVSSGYVEVGWDYFQFFSKAALELVELNAQSRVLDVACGPGCMTLLLAAQAGEVEAVDFSPAMLRILEQKRQALEYQNIKIRLQDAQNLPMEDDRFDAAFSMFGLMFFPDRMRGHSEMRRTLKRGGRAVVSSWAPLLQSSGMQAVFGALRAINKEMPDPTEEVESLENPDYFREELGRAGYVDVEIHPAVQEVDYPNAALYWDAMVRGNAPLLVMKRNTPPDQWAEKSAIAQAYLVENYGPGRLQFSVKAWLGTGVKP